MNFYKTIANAKKNCFLKTYSQRKKERKKERGGGGKDSDRKHSNLYFLIGVNWKNNSHHYK